jgi:hypothetical protein
MEITDQIKYLLLLKGYESDDQSNEQDASDVFKIWQPGVPGSFIVTVTYEEEDDI